MGKLVKCEIDGCHRNVYHCGLCCQHYRRWKKYGDPCAVPTIDTSNYLPKGSYKNNPREYRSWKNMVARCTDSRHVNYPHYGGRGIKICDRWLGKDGLKNFINDMGTRPDNMSLDRIDVDGDYTPENCRWAAQCVQNHNQRDKKHSTGIKGVGRYFHHGRYRFIAYISKNGIKAQKYFSNLDDAIKWRSKKEKELYG